VNVDNGLDNDEDVLLYGRAIDRRTYATENDAPEIKAAVGATLEAPVIQRPTEPISIPAGTFVSMYLEFSISLLSLSLSLFIL